MFERYALPPEPRILDAGCGTGEISSRLATLFPRSRILGIDIIEPHLTLARQRYADLADRLTFERRDAYATALPRGEFDLTVCRHVLHATPYPERVIAELARVTKPGGYLHLLAEDYGMLEFQVHDGLDPRDLWYQVPPQFGARTNTDLFIGRNVFTILTQMHLDEIRVGWAVVDTLRTPRDTFATILEAWRDGYSDSIGELTSFSKESAIAYFDAMIANVRDPSGYAVWMVPIASARIP